MMNWLDVLRERGKVLQTSGSPALGASNACKTPGMRMRSGGRGRGLARGRGRGPIGTPSSGGKGRGPGIFGSFGLL